MKGTATSEWYQLLIHSHRRARYVIFKQGSNKHVPNVSDGSEVHHLPSVHFVHFGCRIWNGARFVETFLGTLLPWASVCQFWKTNVHRAAHGCSWPHLRESGVHKWFQLDISARFPTSWWLVSMNFIALKRKKSLHFACGLVRPH